MNVNDPPHTYPPHCVALRVLLFHYMEDAVFPNQQANSVQDAYTFWTAQHCLKPKDKNSMRYDVTDKGNAYVKMLLSTPLPVMYWHDPRLTCGEPE